jgi:hypothetical protein
MDRDYSATSWGAILAGGVTSAAVTLIVVAFGVGGGLAVISPWEGQGISSTTAHWAAGLFLIAAAMIASTFGGYITGRLRHGWDAVNEDERYFRDTAHGFVTWAFATVLTATALAGAGTHLLGAATAGSIAAVGAASQSSVGDAYVDRLLRPAVQTGDQAQPQPAGDSQAARAELGRIIAPITSRGGAVSDDSKTYAAQVIARRTGLSPADARTRVDQVVSDAKAAADKARSAAMKFALWIAASLLAGAFASSLAAAEGGKLRNSRWYEPRGTAPYTSTTANVRS